MAKYDFTTQRIFVDLDLSANAKIQIERARANYLLSVLRMQSGDQVLVFNGRDGEWLGEICDVKRKSCGIHLLSITRNQPTPSDLQYLFAPIKKARLDYMVQKAVEMGAGELQPVISDFTQFSKINLERMRANVNEAAEQCGILSLAKVCEPQKLSDVLNNWNAERKIIFCDESAEHSNLHDILSPLKNQKLALLVGPEGGFSERERAQLLDLECVVAISLGPRILRADTAAVAALAVLQANAGDWASNSYANQ